MKKFILPLAVFVSAVASQAVLAGDVTGKITLKGTPPPEIPIPFDPVCAAAQPTVTTTRRYVVGKDNGLADVVVYISKGLEGKKFTPPAAAAEINQVGCMYFPFVSAVMAGQTLKFKNSDAFMHNVHATPKVDGNQEFNIAQVNQGDVNSDIWTTSITKPEVMVRVECNVHKWMLTYVAVLDNPYYAVSDKDGNYKISGVPAGDYTLTAYHLKATAGTPGVTKEIKVAGDPVSADFTLEVPAAK